MKRIPLSSRSLRVAAALVLLGATAGPAFGGWASSSFDSKREIFNFADRDGDGNINPSERDLLRAAFARRGDLGIIDRNGNRDLEREEIDDLEQNFKHKKRDKAKKEKEEKLDKKLKKKFKKNR